MTTVTTNSASLRRSLLPLVLDVAVPVGSYYVFRNGLGMSAVAALGWSSAVPAVRTGWSVVRRRTVNAMAALILVVNVAGVLLSFVAGDARLMLVKDSGISSVIGIGVLVSVRLGRPMMTEGMKPFLLRGMPSGSPPGSGWSVGPPGFGGPSGPSRWCGVWCCWGSASRGSWGCTSSPSTPWSGSAPS